MSIGAYLDCDVCSDTPFAESAKGDFRRKMREQAKARGWRRVLRDGRVLDVCDKCIQEGRVSDPTKGSE